MEISLSPLLTGRTEAASLASPNIDSLGMAAITTGGSVGGTLTISWTDTGFSVGDSPGTMNIVGGGVGSAVYTSYVDNTNAPFGTGTQVGTTSPTGRYVTGHRADDRPVSP